MTDDSPPIIDISPPISPATPVWPGDQPFDVRWRQRLAAGDPVDLTTVTMSPHTGAHADAPRHMLAAGPGIDEMELERYIGRALVVDLEGVDAVRAEHLGELDLPRHERILLRTRADGPPRDYASGFAHITPEAAALLAAAPRRLVGIDTPSVDAFTATEPAAHLVFLRAGIAILEGLDLSRAAAGTYELIAPPLRLVGLDGSPVRALLRPLRC